MGTNRYQYQFANQSLVDEIERLKQGDEEGVRFCIDFFYGESEGIWHGRARAKIARNLKAGMLTEKDRIKIVDTVTRRLLTGKFSQQFKDQLNLSLRLSPEATLKAANEANSSPKSYVRRYARWTIARHQRMRENASRRPC